MEEPRALTPLNVFTSMVTVQSYYMTGSPNVLAYAEFCHGDKLFSLTPAKTVHITNCIRGLFEFFHHMLFFLILSLEEGNGGVVSTMFLFGPFMTERFLPWRGRVSYPCILALFVYRRKCTLRISKGLT